MCNSDSSVQCRLDVEKHLAANAASTTCSNERLNSGDDRFIDRAAEMASLLLSEVRQECLTMQSTECAALQHAANVSSAASVSTAAGTHL